MYRRHIRVICLACSLMSAQPSRHLPISYAHNLESVLRGWFCSALKARGDSDSDSDIDILVIVDAVDRRFEAQVSGIASELDLKYDVLLNTHLLTRERWEDYTRRQAALWLNVQRDGIELQFPIAVQ
jgi:predicted nucleotidyltransferase